MPEVTKLTLAEKEQIREAQREYQREYYAKNKKKILASQRQWREENPEKVSEYNQNYWLRRAEQKVN